MKNINWQQLRYDLKRGNNEMLSVFFQEHAGYCTRKLTREHQCSQEDAEDIFIESVMNLREKLISEAMEAVANVRSYLYTTCHYMLMDRMRKKNREGRSEEDVTRFFYESYHTTENDPFDKALIEITRKAWNELSEKCKDILHYFYVDRMDMKEIADVMEFASADVAKTSKSRCYRQFSNRAYELKQSQQL
ncbi:MAG: sigma-70 family RNA polymerase sigma factor [Cytophagales bacterium]|nr:sigma-70 family RNA polymerase sigma factor [Cytophagales bacterium]